MINILDLHSVLKIDGFLESRKIDTDESINVRIADKIAFFKKIEIF